VLRSAADGVAEGGRGPAAQGGASGPLGDREAAGDRPDLGAADAGLRLTAGAGTEPSCADAARTSRLAFTGRIRKT
jgi:hypothetical protein